MKLTIRTIIKLPVLIALLFLAIAGTVNSALADDNNEWLEWAQEIFTDADRIGGRTDDLVGIPVFNGSQKLGYLFLTNDIYPIPAYSGKPINILVGMDLGGKLVRTKIIEHHEPILLAGISEAQLARFIAQYEGVNIFDNVRIGGSSGQGVTALDAITGASITVMVANATIIESARKLARAQGIIRTVEEAPLDLKHDSVENHLLHKQKEFLPDSMVKIIWEKKIFQIVVLVISLIFLTTILLFQDWLVRRPRFYEWMRHLFLLYTVFFIGWYSLAQLSIVNVFTFVHAIIHDFHWETFALDPMMFILWGFVTVTLILWGRGIYCGWLCPFGALQELINIVARHLKVKQWEFPYMVHERLWALKYVILIMLFGLSLQSVNLAEQYAEIEPFKTVYLLQFNREAPFVIYAVLMILVSIINRKFYCKYLCPLGAALVIPAQNRLFNWVRRRSECGQPCQVCAHECEVQAISPMGEINKNECHYCLDCQVTYYNDHKCPPIVSIRKKREKRQAQMVQFKE